MNDDLTLMKALSELISISQVLEMVRKTREAPKTPIPDDVMIEGLFHTCRLAELTIDRTIVAIGRHQDISEEEFEARWHDAHEENVRRMRGAAKR